MTTLVDLRARGLFPTLFLHRVPGGVLHDIGYALWEMPANSGGGYTAMLKEDLDQYDAFLQPIFRTLPNTANKLTLTELRDALYGPFGALDMTKLPTTYAEGTSLILQNCVLQVRRIGGVDSIYDSRPVVADIRASMDPNTRLWIHCGMAENILFPQHEINALVHYSHQVKQGRPNPGQVVVNQAAYPVIGTRKYIHIGSTISAQATQLVFYRPPLDPTIPEIVQLDLQQVTEMVTAFGPEATFVLFGETYGSVLPPGDGGLCNRELLASVCAACEPVSSYRDADIEGFQAYLVQVLGLDRTKLRARWGGAADSAGIREIDDVNAVAQVYCPDLPAALRDWRDYVSLKLRSLRRHEYAAAKAAVPTVRATTMVFGVGIEQSWLESDFGSVGDWVNSEDTYLAQGRWPMQTVCAFAKLSGEPPAFAISSPPAKGEVPPGQDLVPPILRVIRTLNANNTRWWLRDILCAGAGHIGYRRGPVGSLEFHAPTANAVSNLFADVRSMQPTMLENHGPHQRIALHVEDPELIHTTDYDPRLRPSGARVADFLEQKLKAEHATYALFSDASRVLGRSFALAHLKRSIVVSLYPSSPVRVGALLREHFTAAKATGCAVIVYDPLVAEADTADIDPSHLLAVPVGRLHRCGGSDSRLFVLHTRPGATCEGDAFYALVADSLQRVVIPYLIANHTTATGMPFVLSPLEVTTVAPRVFTNFVSDGLNFTVAVSNMGEEADGPVDVDVTVKASVAAALDVTYPTHNLTLDPGETEFVQLQAVPSGIDIAAAIADGVTRLGALAGDGFDTTHGEKLLDQAEARRVAGDNGRALGAYLAAIRALYVKTSFNDPTLTVTVARAKLLGEGAGSLAVDGAEVQAFFPRNVFELAAHGVTDASGVVSMVIGWPMEKHWSLLHNRPVAAPLARSPLDLQVVDPATGDGTRITLPL